MDAYQPADPMKTFVIIFRQARKPLIDADKQRLAEEMGPWARRQNEAGRKLDPRILAPESADPGPEGSTAAPTDAWPVTALLFLEAHDLSEARRVAETHPGRRFGAKVEVRPWGPPVPPPARTPATP
jgi:hypothetical protein